MTKPGGMSKSRMKRIRQKLNRPSQTRNKFNAEWRRQVSSSISDGPTSAQRQARAEYDARVQRDRQRQTASQKPKQAKSPKPKPQARVIQVVTTPANVLPSITREQATEFYESREWKTVRYKAIRRAKGVCETCGAAPGNGIYLNIDHIKPLRFFWSLRLDLENLQCLCSDCNTGKGNWDQTNWRRA